MRTRPSAGTYRVTKGLRTTLSQELTGSRVILSFPLAACGMDCRVSSLGLAVLGAASLVLGTSACVEFQILVAVYDRGSLVHLFASSPPT